MARGLSRLDIIEHALEAVRNEFELELAAEWNAHQDSAEIRNAIIALPNRCRHCKRPVAGISVNICACRGRIEQERCVSNPRAALLELFRERCNGIVTSASLARFVRTVTKIGLAHNRNLSWVEDQIHGLLPLFRGASRKWFIEVCSHPSVQFGMLPAWSRDEVEVLHEADLRRSLSTDDTEAELAKVEAEIGPFFQDAKKRALDRASIQIAQFLRADSKRGPSRRARQDLTAALIAAIKQDNPVSSIEAICKTLDSKRCPVRPTDKNAGFSTWHGVWEDPQRRNRIKRFISDIQPAPRAGTRPPPS